MRRRHTAGAGVAGLALVLAGCAPSGEDVRVSFCRAVVQTQQDAPIRWLSTGTRPRRQAGLDVTLGFEGTGGALQEAVCHYRFDAVDDTAQALADPLSVYGTSPVSVTIDGRTLSAPVLADAIRRAALRQGRDLLERVPRG